MLKHLVLLTLVIPTLSFAGTIPIPTDNGWILYDTDKKRATVHSYDGTRPMTPSERRRQEEAETERAIQVEKAKIREQNIQKCVEDAISKQDKYHKKSPYFVRKECERKYPR